jgi:hypothetical protein
VIHPDIRRELGRDRVAELARARATTSRDERNPRGLRRLLRLWAGRLWPPNHQPDELCLRRGDGHAHPDAEGRVHPSNRKGATLVCTPLSARATAPPGAIENTDRVLHHKRSVLF